MFKKVKRTDSWDSMTVNVRDPVNLTVVKTRCDCCREHGCCLVS
ncbi:MAG: hypothetical protein V3W20_12890 [Candidatus Neomarinimicrobiota bacterium]